MHKTTCYLNNYIKLFKTNLNYRIIQKLILNLSDYFFKNIHSITSVIAEDTITAPKYKFFNSTLRDIINLLTEYIKRDNIQNNLKLESIHFHMFNKITIRSTLNINLAFH